MKIQQKLKKKIKYWTKEIKGKKISRKPKDLSNLKNGFLWTTIFTICQVALKKIQNSYVNFHLEIIQVLKIYKNKWGQVSINLKILIGKTDEKFILKNINSLNFVLFQKMLRIKKLKVVNLKFQKKLEEISQKVWDYFSKIKMKKENIITI